jgi:hypothetical protein
MGVIHITSAEQFSQLKNSKSTFGSPAAVVVDFSAEVWSILVSGRLYVVYIAC